MRILFVDDEPAIVQAVTGVLKDLGHGVTTAEDGRRALELCQDQSFDLVVSDIRMPHVDGLKLLATLRERGVATPVILISGHREEDGAVTPGPDVAYLRKPMRLRELVECMTRLTGDAETAPE